MRTIKIKSVMVAITLLISIRMFSGGSVSFDKEAWKKGETTTGKWSVYKDWKIDSSPTSSHLGKPNIPKAAGPADGKFKAEAKEYTKTKDEAVIYLILENTKTGETEDESNAPKDTCTIVGIEGEMTGKTWLDFKRAIVRVDAIAHPKTMGSITNAKLEVTIPTMPKTPYDWDSSGNEIRDEEVFFSEKKFLREDATSSLDFGGFHFLAEGTFSHGEEFGVEFK